MDEDLSGKPVPLYDHTFDRWYRDKTKMHSYRNQEEVTAYEGYLAGSVWASTFLLGVALEAAKKYPNNTERMISELKMAIQHMIQGEDPT